MSHHRDEPPAGDAPGAVTRRLAEDKLAAARRSEPRDERTAGALGLNVREYGK